MWVMSFMKRKNTLTIYSRLQYPTKCCNITSPPCAVSAFLLFIILPHSLCALAIHLYPPYTPYTLRLISPLIHCHCITHSPYLRQFPRNSFSNFQSPLSYFLYLPAFYFTYSTTSIPLHISESLFLQLLSFGMTLYDIAPSYLVLQMVNFSIIHYPNSFRFQCNQMCHNLNHTKPSYIEICRTGKQILIETHLFNYDEDLTYAYIFDVNVLAKPDYNWRIFPSS